MTGQLVDEHVTRRGHTLLADLVLDRDSPVPLYHQVLSRLESAIEGGELRPGSLLGNEIELARQLGLSRPTLRMAIAKLVERGLLIRRRGIGTVVAPALVRRPFALTSLHDDLVAAGQHPVTRILTLHEMPAPDEIATALQLGASAPVLHLRRLRLVDEVPIALMTNYLPLGVLPDAGSGLEGSGLYDLLRRRGVQPKIANQSVGACAATATEARLLAVRRGAPLLTMRRTAFDDSGQPVEHGIHLYPADRYTLEMTVVRR